MHRNEEYGKKVQEVTEFRPENFESIPSLNFDEYLLQNYNVNDEIGVVQEDDFRPSKKEPELVQIMPLIISEEGKNSSRFTDTNFGEPFTPLPNLSEKEHSLDFDRNRINQEEHKNNKPYIVKSYDSNTVHLPSKPNMPSKSLGYQAAKMAEKYRNKRRNKKRRKIRKKQHRPQSKTSPNPQPPTSVHATSPYYNSPNKRNIGVSIGITSIGPQSSNTFTHNPAEDFYYSYPKSIVSAIESDQQGHSIIYTSPSYYGPKIEYGDSEHPVSIEGEYIADHHPIDPYDPKDNALLLLAPSGPRIPILNRLVSDMTGMISAPFDPTRESLSSKVGNSMYENGKYIMNKITSGTIDGEMDIFDFLPIIGVLVAGSLIIAGLFPTALTSFGFNNGNFIIGRNLDIKKGRYETEKETMFGLTLNHLEAGMMLMNALRLQDTGCTEKLACRMSETYHRYSDNVSSNNWILNVADKLMPESFNDSNFFRSFRMVLENRDTSSCNKECYRCVAL